MTLRRGKPLRRRSQKREDAAEEEALVRLAVFVRDRWGCRLASLGGCWGDPTPHHLRKAHEGGPYSLENLICLCVGHNRWVEDHPPEARRLGLVERGLETPADTWMTLHRSGLAAAPYPGAGPGPGLATPPEE